MDDQLVIKVILIAAFIVFALILVMPVGGARRLAIRRLLLVMAFGAAVVAIAFPQLIADLASLLGVGRGADLVLYALVVVFIGNAITQSAHNRHLQRELTSVARSLAIAQAPPPDSVHDRAR